MSALPPKADIAERRHHVRFVPIAEISLADLACKKEQKFPSFVETARGAAVFAAEIRPVEPVWVIPAKGAAS
jgi:hypothetical protein